MPSVSVGFAQRAQWLKLAIEHGAGANEVIKQVDGVVQELGGVPGAVFRMRPDSAAIYLVSLLLASMVVEPPPLPPAPTRSGH